MASILRSLRASSRLLLLCLSFDCGGEPRRAGPAKDEITQPAVPAGLVFVVWHTGCPEGCDPRVSVASARRLSDADLRLLWGRALELGFFELPSDWMGEDCTTCQPQVELHVGYEGEGHSVRYDTGCSDRITRQLNGFNSLIEQLVAPERVPATGVFLADWGVFESSSGRFRISRRLLDQLLKRPDLVEGRTRLFMKPEGGREELRIAGVRRDSLPGKLGLQNADSIVAIDRTKVPSAPELLALLGRVRDRGRATVLLRRRGMPLVHEYLVGE